MSTIKQSYKSNLVVVNNKSNFKSHLVKCQTVMDNIQFDELILKGMGKAVTRAKNLATQLNLNNYKTFEIKENLYTVDIVDDEPTGEKIFGYNRDEFDPEVVDTNMRKVTKVPAIEIIVRRNPLEISKLRKSSYFKQELHKSSL